MIEVIQSDFARLEAETEAAEGEAAKQYEERIDHIFDKINLHYGDLVDSSNLCAIMAKVRPDEIYNLAAQSHVKVSFEEPEYTSQADGAGTLRLLEAIRTCGLEKYCRFYQASTSELYGS